MFWLLIFVVVFTSCDINTNKKQKAPDPVRLVLRGPGADTTNSEPGIDAVPTPEGEINQIQIQWYHHPQTKQLTKFNIYRSQEPEGNKNYVLIGNVQANIPGQPDTIFFDTQDLQLNVRYYYYVTAVNKDMVESTSSDTVSYKLLEKPVKLSLNANASVISKPDMNFEWWMESGNTPDRYILRIERFYSKDVHILSYIRYVGTEYGSAHQSFRLQGDSLTTIFPNGKYRWRVDCVGREDVVHQYFEGSESNWKIFDVMWGN